MSIIIGTQMRYTNEEVAIFEAFIYDSKYKRSRLFNINDLKIWKAFI